MATYGVVFIRYWDAITERLGGRSAFWELIGAQSLALVGHLPIVVKAGVVTAANRF